MQEYLKMSKYAPIIAKYCMRWSDSPYEIGTYELITFESRIPVSR